MEKEKSPFRIKMEQYRDEKRERYEKKRLARVAELRPKDTSTRKKTVHTKLGTPCSPKWEKDWIAEVEKTEEKLGHRCCGAHALDEFPCELESTSENGRCRFHGGGLGIGAPKGNSNARIHGLYARRLQQCGPHCPRWNTCPYAGEDVKALPESKRPNCFYETEELEALRKLDAAAHQPYVPLEDRDLDELNARPYPVYAPLLMLRENLHMLQIMIGRAARALSTTEVASLANQGRPGSSPPRSNPVR